MWLDFPQACEYQNLVTCTYTRVDVTKWRYMTLIPTVERVYKNKFVDEV
jgi:hypothetical protein